MHLNGRPVANFDPEVREIFFQQAANQHFLSVGSDFWRRCDFGND